MAKKGEGSGSTRSTGVPILSLTRQERERAVEDVLKRATGKNLALISTDAGKPFSLDGITYVLSETPSDFLKTPKAIAGFAGDTDTEQENHERLKARHAMLLALLGEHVEQKLRHLFPRATTVTRFRIRFDSVGAASARDYAEFFSVLDRTYRFLLSFAKLEYFEQRWLGGHLPNFDPDDLWRVHGLHKASPGEVEGSGLKEVASVLGDVLSVGKQIESVVKIPSNLRFDLEKKQAELAALKRERAIAEASAALDEKIAIARKELELKQLETEILVQDAKRRELIRKEVEETIIVISKALPVLEHLPPQLQQDIKIGLMVEKENLHKLPFVITGIDLAKKATPKKPDEKD
jgi:hypothetical protein